jgi:hypothetical protein
LNRRTSWKTTAAVGIQGAVLELLLAEPLLEPGLVVLDPMLPLSLLLLVVPIELLADVPFSGLVVAELLEPLTGPEGDVIPLLLLLAPLSLAPISVVPPAPGAVAPLVVLLAEPALPGAPT